MDSVKEWVQIASALIGVLLPVAVFVRKWVNKYKEEKQTAENQRHTDLVDRIEELEKEVKVIDGHTNQLEKNSIRMVSKMESISDDISELKESSKAMASEHKQAFLKLYKIQTDWINEYFVRVKGGK